MDSQYSHLRIFIFIEKFLKPIIRILKSKLDRKYLIMKDAIANKTQHFKQMDQTEYLPCSVDFFALCSGLAVGVEDYCYLE